MFNNIFCEMNIKKVIHWVGRVNGGTILIASWKCNFSIYLDIQVYYLDIQAITTLLCIQFVLYVSVPSIHSFVCYNCSPEKKRWAWITLKCNWLHYQLHVENCILITLLITREKMWLTTITNYIPSYIFNY